MKDLLLLEPGDELRVWVTGDNVFELSLARGLPIKGMRPLYGHFTSLAATRAFIDESTVSPIVVLINKLKNVRR